MSLSWIGLYAAGKGVQPATMVAIAVSSASFAAYGLSCFVSRQVVTEFERYRLASHRKMIGTLQIAASLGMVAGATAERFRPFLTLSAAGLAAMMFLALLVRLRIRDPWTAALPALGFLCLNLYIIAAST